MLNNPDLIISVGYHTIEFVTCSGKVVDGVFQPYVEHEDTERPSQLWITGPDVTDNRPVCIKLAGYEEIQKLYATLRSYYGS